MPMTTVDTSIHSLCPICLRVVIAHLFEEDGAIKLEKECQEHGVFCDIYWSDSDLYKKFNRYWYDGKGLDDPKTSVDRDCPFSCGICSGHKTHTLLANIDLTNRCNMSCPVCFANSEVSGRLYEPSLDQIREMMKSLRRKRPVPCIAVQFSGGEPTLRSDLSQIVAMAREMGFSHIQIATNGLRLASSLELCKNLRLSGLQTLYLQFDGVTPEPYNILRGGDVLHSKLRAIANCRESGLRSIVLVPTLEKGVNDGQMGDIVRFAAENLDVIRGVNVQPISFAGRIDQGARNKSRITIPDFLALIEVQTDNEISREDFYPVPFVAPISHLIGLSAGLHQMAFTVHPHCGAATYIFYHQGKFLPINRFLDVEGLFERINEAVANFDGSNLGRIKMNGKILKELPKLIDENGAPDGLNITRLLLDVIKNGTRESLSKFHNRTLFLGAMHFQDLYNFDIERVQRCGIHYATPDGRIIPFCTYNAIHRQGVEDQFSIAMK
jgi:uncharacterized radical SAM superfamily Fe-S cluster-containing enzyme